MRIAIVSTFYSEGMGYVENCLPKFLAALGHEVHLIASTLNVYGTSPDYQASYRAFLGPAEQPPGMRHIDGYCVHRLPFGMVSGYVFIRDLTKTLRKLRPDIVHCTEIASLPAFAAAAAKAVLHYNFFAETHQHLSVVKPYLRFPGGPIRLRALYWATRTLPSALASTAVTKCYAIAPDCLEVANRFYGVPRAKLVLQSLGTDVDLFRPPADPDLIQRRADLRERLGYRPDDVVCIYTGRFTVDKNPLALAQAVDRLAADGRQFRSLFIGDGPQRAEIASCRKSTVVPFMRHRDLADYYRMADIAVWPRQESMSMLDAASSGLPIVASDRIGEKTRITGNGFFYLEDDVPDLARQLSKLESGDARAKLALAGRHKVLESFNWHSIAQSIARDYAAARARS